MFNTQAAQDYLSSVPGSGPGFIHQAIQGAVPLGVPLMAKTLYLLHSKPAWRRTATYRDVLCAFDQVCHFFIDSPDEFLSEFSSWRLSLAENSDVRRSIALRYGQDLTGLQLTNGKDVALFLADASQPGKVRALWYGKHGFKTHLTRDTYPQLLHEMLQRGYTEESSENLDHLFQHEQFHRGYSEAAYA